MGRMIYVVLGVVEDELLSLWTLAQLPETYKPSSGLFLFQASQAMKSSQRPIMAE